jgi:two-component system, chemotaxis family, chemotaxis protein CheY
MDSLKVLIVDDSPIIARKLTMMVELLGYKVVKTAATGTEAITAYRACRPDVVTMDITMPDMDGIEATRRIMAEFPDAKIVMVTSHGQEKMVLDALKAGAKGYVLKPFDGNKVSEAIQKACKRVVLKDKLPADAPTAEPAEGNAKPAAPQVSG